MNGEGVSDPVSEREGVVVRRTSEEAVLRVRAVVLPSLAAALGVGEELVTDDLELETLGLNAMSPAEVMSIVVDEDSLAEVKTVGALMVALATDVR